VTNPGPNSRLVYSTDGGRVRQAHSAAPKPAGSPPSVPDDGVVRIQRDKRGRGGKTATTITGLPGTEAQLDSLLKSLKSECGTGGSRDGRVLVLQGDQRERLLPRLTALGYRAKLAGG
jgi:translation initiation factor 1